MVYLKNIAIIGCFLLLAGCNTQPAKQLHPQGDTKPTVHNHADTASADQGDQPSESQEQSVAEIDMVPAWAKIETHQIVVPADPQTWLFSPTGLAFQMVDSLPDPNMKLFQPIGDALLRPNGSVLIGFPDHDVVAWFNPANQYKAQLFGSMAYGGKGEPINQPAKLAADPKSIWLMEANQKVIAHFDKALHLQEVVQPGISSSESTVLYPSADGNWLMTSLLKPTLFYRLSPQRQVLTHFSLPNRDGSSEANMPQLNSYEDGSVVGIRAAGHNAFHCDKVGKIVRQFDFDFSGASLTTTSYDEGWRGVDAAFSQPLYYFLFKNIQTNASYLMRTTPAGKLVNFVAVPFPADGMSVQATAILLFERKTGKAQMYQVN